MKIGTFVMMILVIGLVFSVIGSIVGDFQTQYTNSTVNTDWAEDYDYSKEINSSVSNLKIQLEKLDDENVGWFEKLGAGITAIPFAVIAAVDVILESASFGINIVADLGAEFGVPSSVIFFGVTALIIAVVFMLISFWRRYRA